MISKSLRSAVLTILLSFIAGVIGILLGHRYIMPNAGKPVSLHDRIHNELVLDKAQNEKLHAMEISFAAQKSVLETRMKNANARLRAAMQSSHDMSEEVLAAKADYVESLDALQTLTLEHIFAMRAQLTPEQAAQFDQIVERSFRKISH